MYLYNNLMSQVLLLGVMQWKHKGVDIPVRLYNIIAVSGGGWLCTTKSTLQKQLIVPFTSCNFRHGKGDLFNNKCPVPICNSFSFSEYLPRAYQETDNLLGVGDRDE